MDSTRAPVIPLGKRASALDGKPSVESIGDMVWMYERGAEILRIETRYDKVSSAYELVWHRPDGTHTVEQFLSETTFRVRLEAVEAVLRQDQWMSSGPPEILKDGWRT